MENLQTQTKDQRDIEKTSTIAHVLLSIHLFLNNTLSIFSCPLLPVYIAYTHPILQLFIKIASKNMQHIDFYYPSQGYICGSSMDSGAAPVS